MLEYPDLFSNGKNKFKSFERNANENKCIHKCVIKCIEKRNINDKNSWKNTTFVIEIGWKMQ